MNYRYKILLCIIFISICLTGCTNKKFEIESFANHEDMKENSQYGNIDMEFSRLDGKDIRTFSSYKGKVYTFDYTYLVIEGTLKIEFRDSDDMIIDEVTLSSDEYNEKKKELEKENENGKVSLIEMGSNIRIKSNDKKIKIVLIGDSARGKINIKW